MTNFGGFPPGLFEFYRNLAADNSKVFWQANKTQWEQEVRNPMRLLLGELSEEFGELRMFRPNRDLRFTTDKSPYKLWTGATSATSAVGGIGYYLEVSAECIVAGYGTMLLASDQLRRFRSAIDRETSGHEFEQLVDTLSKSDYPVSHGIEPPLKTAPRGYQLDHPRIYFLRWKGVAVVHEWPMAEWMYTRETLESIRKIWRAAEPLKEWLNRYVAGD